MQGFHPGDLHPLQLAVSGQTGDLPDHLRHLSAVRPGIHHDTAADAAGDAGIWRGAAVPKDSAQVVASLCFDDRIHIFPGDKSRPKGNGNGCHVFIGAKVLLGKNRIYNGDRL